jgi:hypothetical protein
MKNLYSLPFLLLGLLIGSHVLAAGYLTAHVIQVRVDRQGQGMVVFDATISGTQPSCVAAPYVNAFAFDANTAGGRAILSTALSAKATGSMVTVYGNAACSTYGSYVEDWG